MVRPREIRAFEDTPHDPIGPSNVVTYKEGAIGQVIIQQIKRRDNLRYCRSCSKRLGQSEVCWGLSQASQTSDMDLTEADDVHLDAVFCQTPSLGESFDSVFLRRDLCVSKC